MRVRRLAFAVAVCLAAAAVTLEGLQYVPPRIPPSEAGLPSVYELLDLGSAPAVTCSCVPKPFALPSYRPGWGYGTGPGVPLEDAPLSDADRERNRQWYAGEHRDAAALAEDALAGNGHASMAVASHLAVRKIILGPDDRVEQDVVRWLTLAAQQAHPDAYRLLGYHYAHGRGVAPSDTVAAYWFDQGARHDDPISMTAIGFLLAAGRGLTQDWPAAIRWWQRAEGRTPLAARFLGDAYACGIGVDENRERALSLYKSAATQDASSAIQLGHLYARGCASPDDKAAVAAFKRAADEGYPEAQIELSDLLRQGHGGEANPYEAYYWASIAERRLPSGDVKKVAQARAFAASRLMSAFETADADKMVTAMLTACAERRR
jgi:TPR repeat protein